MALYATVDDYEARWGTLPESECDRCTTLLEDASVVLDDAVERYNIDVDARQRMLVAVCCDLVHRRFESESASNVASITQQAGSFAETIRWNSGVRGAMTLTDDDLSMLGVRRAGVTWGIPGLTS